MSRKVFLLKLKHNCSGLDGVQTVSSFHSDKSSRNPKNVPRFTNKLILWQLPSYRMLLIKLVDLVLKIKVCTQAYRHRGERDKPGTVTLKLTLYLLTTGTCFAYQKIYWTSVPILLERYSVDVAKSIYK